MAKGVACIPRTVKKTIELNQDCFDTARRIFAVNTEKEAVNKALEMAISIIKSSRPMRPWEERAIWQKTSSKEERT